MGYFTIQSRQVESLADFPSRRYFAWNCIRPWSRDKMYEFYCRAVHVHRLVVLISLLRA